MLNKVLKRGIVVLFFFNIILVFFAYNNKHFSSYLFRNFASRYNQYIGSISQKKAIPFGEFFYLFVFSLFLLLLVNIFKNALKKEKKKLIRSASVLFIFFNILSLFYVSVWGVNYHKTTIENKISDHNISVTELKELYFTNLKQLVSIRQEIKGELKIENGAPLLFGISDFEYERIFLTHQKKIAELKFIKNYNELKNPKFKYSYFSSIQNYLGVLGYYNPFTVEANVNQYNTDLKKGLTIFHEFAHQMGFGSESEANFIAFYIAINSSNKKIEYAAYYKLIFTLLHCISKQDPLFVKNELDFMSDLVKRDRKAEIKHYEQYVGTLSDQFNDLNDQFLKLNSQEGEISYSNYIKFIYLLNKKIPE